MVKAQFRTGFHPRLLPKPNFGLEVPEPDASGQIDGTLLPGAVFGAVAGRRGHRDGRRGRDAAVLECVQQGPVAEGDEIRTQLVYRYTIAFLFTFLYISGSFVVLQYLVLSFGNYMYNQFS